MSIIPKIERRPEWIPAKQAPHYPIGRAPMDTREVDAHKYEKYENHPKDQRAQYIHKRDIDKPMMRNPTGPRPRYDGPPRPKYEAATRPKYDLPSKPKYEAEPKMIYESGPKLKYEGAPKPKYETEPRAKYHPSQDHPSVSAPKMRPKEDAKPKPNTPLKTKPRVVPKQPPKINETTGQNEKIADVKNVGAEETPLDEATDASKPAAYFELSPLMARMLDMELQDIMIKVWQELPDKPTTDAEKLVVNKLRNKAGDDIRNAFGLNTSQRLLNVFNIMYIKMIFTANPDGQELALFLLKNGITNFKWNNVKPLCFVAVVTNVNDFDRLCATQNYTIGNVKVTITPLYQFTKCPQRLRTNYTISNPTKNPSSTGTKGNVSEGTDPPPAADEAKVTEVAVNDDKATKTIDAKPVSTKTDEKPAEKESAKVEVSDNKESTKNETKETAKVDTIVKVKPKEVTKVSTNANASKNVGKQIIRKDEKKQVDKTEIRKEPVKKTPSKKPKASCTNILQDGDDYDELDDDEIMALVSQGIILDECSGSDID